MFVILSSFQARPGEEDAIVALHEDWVRSLRRRTHGFISGELLSSCETSSSFVRISRFDDEESARRTEGDPEQAAWAHRLSSLAVGRIQSASFQVAWLVDSTRPVNLDSSSGVDAGIEPSVHPSPVTRPSADRSGVREEVPG